MKTVAELVSGCSEEELLEYEFRTVTSSDDAYYVDGVPVRSSERLAAHLIVGNADLPRQHLSVSFRKLLRP